MGVQIDLPSLKMLATFESAARVGSFKDAALELGVTAGAVSHQIRGLERDLGFALFMRRARSVELTNDGRILFETLHKSLLEISNEISALRRVHETMLVGIGATTAVSSLWLTPRLAEFWRDNPEIQVHQEVRDRPFRRPLSQDLIIQYSIDPPKEPADILFDDHLLPLCSPDFDQSGIWDIERLSQSPLIHLDANETNWTSWPNWLEAYGYTGSVSDAHRVNNYTIALQLAQDGFGIVLGWRRLVDSLLKTGKLVPLGDFEIPAPGRFYLIRNPNFTNHATRILVDWFLQRKT